MTYFRVSLVGLYVRLAEMMGKSSLSLVQLLTTVLQLPGKIQETSSAKLVTLEQNPSDPDTMRRLSAAIDKINAMKIRTLGGKQMKFRLE